MSQKAKDVFDCESDLEDLIDEADGNAVGYWEEEFVSDMRDKFDEYGLRMFMSDKQKDILDRIASGESHRMKR